MCLVNDARLRRGVACSDDLGLKSSDALLVPNDIASNPSNFLEPIALIC